ncbi:hypothetical protein GS483_00350 [Rhodococcus hoagii]|nr:hypothetical protein [Prescottella equi]
MTVDDLAAHVVAALTNAGKTIVDAVDVEERWVPVTESGARWAPRSREKADAALADWPAGGTGPNGLRGYDGVTHIVHERLVRTDWEPVAAARVAEGGDQP